MPQGEFVRWSDLLSTAPITLQRRRVQIAALWCTLFAWAFVSPMCAFWKGRATERFVGPFDHSLASPTLIISNSADVSAFVRLVGRLQLLY